MEEYLASVDGEKRAALEELRRTIREMVPEAEESLSYGLAAFRLNGRALVAFGATEKHCALYPMSPAVIESHREELSGYDTSKGTIRFQPTRPLPAKLLKKIVAGRIQELAPPPPRRGAQRQAIKGIFI